MKKIIIKPNTVTVNIPLFPNRVELEEAEANKERLENSGYHLIRSTDTQLVYQLTC